MAKNKFFQVKDEQKDDKDIYNFERGITSNDKKDMKIKDQQNQNEYSDHIHVKESPGKEQLFDRNNPFVRILLAIMGLIVVLGTAYYIYIYVTTM